MQIALADDTSREDDPQNRSEKAEWFAGTFGLTTSSDVFEIGSGEGIVARALAGACRSVTCCYVSRTFLDRARKTCSHRDNVRFHLIGPEYLAGPPDGTFQFGYSMNVFIHFNLRDIYHYLSEVNRILTPGGRFYFDTRPSALPRSICSGTSPPSIARTRSRSVAP